MYILKKYSAENYVNIQKIRKGVSAMVRYPSLMTIMKYPNWKRIIPPGQTKNNQININI